MRKYILNRDSLQVWLDNDLSFNIKHSADEETFDKIRALFERIFKQLGRR